MDGMMTFRFRFTQRDEGRVGKRRIDVSKFVGSKLETNERTDEQPRTSTHRQRNRCCVSNQKTIRSDPGITAFPRWPIVSTSTTVQALLYETEDDDRIDAEQDEDGHPDQDWELRREESTPTERFGQLFLFGRGGIQEEWCRAVTCR